MLAGKALTVNMLEVNCFQSPTVAQPFVSQHKAHIREMVNYFFIVVAQVYRVYMTWKLAVNAAISHYMNVLVKMDLDISLALQIVPEHGPCIV